MASTLRVEKMWTLAEARSLISTLQPHLFPLGFHVALGGGVLNRGYSKKDLDLYFLPLDNDKVKVDDQALLKFLNETWGPGRPMRAASDALRYYTQADPTNTVPTTLIDRPPAEQDYPKMQGSPYTHKLKFTWSDLRIDVFIIGMTDEAKSASTEIEAAKEPNEVEALIPPGMAERFTLNVPPAFPQDNPFISAWQGIEADTQDELAQTPNSLRRSWITRHDIEVMQDLHNRIRTVGAQGVAPAGIQRAPRNRISDIYTREDSE